MIVPRTVFDDTLRSQAIAAGAVPVTARIVGAERKGDGSVNHLTAADGQTLRGRVVMAADGALSPVAHLMGMVDSDTALWGFAIRGYLNAHVPLPLLALLDAEPRRIFPGYGWLFPGADGRANIGIGLALPRRERPAAALRQDLARLCARLEASHDLPNSHVEAITGGWLRMGGVGSRPRGHNVLLVGDAAGLVNPLQGEGIAQAMISGRLAADAVLADPRTAAPRTPRRSPPAFSGWCPGPRPCRPRCSARQRRLRPAVFSSRDSRLDVGGHMVAATGGAAGSMRAAAPGRPGARA